MKVFHASHDVINLGEKLNETWPKKPYIIIIFVEED